MINVIKMDLYRMVKNKATWLIFLASMLMMFASIFMTSQDLAYYNSNPTALQDLQANGDEVNWGIYIGSVKPEWCTGTEVPLMELVAVNVKSKLLLMFLVVFVTYFAGSEGRNGFLKNIAGQVTHKGIFVFSKSVVISIFAVMMIAGAVLATMLGSVAFLGYINIANIGQGCVFLIVQILLHIAYGMFVLFLFNVTESSVATMLAGILIAAGILQIVDAILVSVFSKLQAISDFSIMNYLTSGNVGLLSLDSTSGLYIRASIIAVEFKNANITPDISIPEKPIYIWANDMALRRVFQNVLKNVIEHGGKFVCISLIEMNSVIEITFHNDILHDTDIDTARVFDRFYKSDKARSSLSTGLGLSIAKELLDKMNGDISANVNDNIFEIVIKLEK